MRTLAFILGRLYLAIPGGARIITVALVMALGLAPASVSNATDANLVGWWKFDEGAGDTAYDSAGTNHGTIYGAQWASGIVGGGLSFDGIDDYVTVGKNDNVFPNNVLTWLAWIKPSAYTSEGVILWDDDFEGGGDRGIELWSDARIGAGDWFVDTISSSRISLDHWHHIAFSSGDAERKLYINGELNATDPGLLPDHTGRSYISIGSGHDGFRGYFCGLIDDVLIYNRALSVEEIRQLYPDEFGNKAFNPYPANGAIGVDPNSVLSWSAGTDGVRHDVYLGTDFDDMNDAATDSPEYRGRQDANSYDPCGLGFYTKYYWRIDEVNENDANGPWKGKIWCFTTASFDSYTVALWLFDETEYPYTTLTDASEYEYDLCLMDSGSLVAGKFGNALGISGSSFTSAYASFKGAVPPHHMKEDDGQPSGLWGPTVAPEKILDALADTDWTCEFWLKLSGTPESEVSILDIGDAYGPGAYVNLSGDAASFEVENAYAGFEASCPTNSGQLTDGQWHHVAFTYDASVGEFEHYLDGQIQAAPTVSTIAAQPTPAIVWPWSLRDDSFGFTASSPLEWRRQNRFNITVGHSRQGSMAMNGMVDEVRLSNIIRYSGSFTAPGSFSRNYGSVPSEPAVPTGPELLFPSGSPSIPVQIGSRKHLFIDEVMIDTKENIQLTVNPPADPQGINPDLFSLISVFDYDGKVYLVFPDGYGSHEGITRLWISDDGLNFDEPDLGVIEYDGSTHNNIILFRTPMWCSAFKDSNPNIGPGEQFKITGWVANRGIYLYLSPDGVHWRRNETCMLPLVSGGGCETFWDDQRGCYVNFLKRDGSFHNEGCEGTGRRGVMFETNEVFKTWPFVVRPNPYFEGWPFPAVTCEGPVILDRNGYGDVYRTRATKYEWAPDVYLAFIWRYDEVIQTDLGVSRDGTYWQTYANIGWYMPAGATFQGNPIAEVASMNGLIRRGDEIWQYANYGTEGHLSGERTTVRLTQRLDGFVSLDAGAQTGVATTLPLVFDGTELVLNVTAIGSLRVGILNEAGDTLPGLDVTDCDPTQGDLIEHVVTWNGKSNLGSLSGDVVRLQIEMQDTKLYAFQFTRLGEPGLVADGPNPPDGAENVSRDVVLRWCPGKYAALHDVYFGTDFDDVSDANKSSREYKDTQNLDAHSYDPCGLLELGTTYYWRIDEVKGPNTWKGDVWGFVTVDHIVVDDMESYETTSDLYSTWVDARRQFIPTGAVLYLGDYTCCPVHGGDKAMRYEYWTDISETGWSELNYAEAYLPLIGDKRDWMEAGVKAVTVYFFGDPNNDVNATEQMYVGVSDGSDTYAEVRYGDYRQWGDMNDIKTAEWQEWNIALKDFTDANFAEGANDVNLAAISKLYMGFGSRRNPVPGGDGIVYFDDIRLYGPKCVPSFAKPIADFSSDCLVNFDDFTVLGNQWMQAPGSPSADIAPEVPDGVVDWLDLATFVDSWLKEELWPPEE